MHGLHLTKPRVLFALLATLVMQRSPSHIIGDLEIMTEIFGTADALTLVAIWGAGAG